MRQREGGGRGASGYSSRDLCLWGSSPESELRQARQTQREAQMLYEQELKRYEDLKDDLERYNRLQKQIDNAQ